MARRGAGRMATRKSAFLREQLGNNRPRSGRVVGCRFVFAADNPIRSDRTRLTRCPRPTTLALNSVSAGTWLLKGTIREQLAEKGR